MRRNKKVIIAVLCILMLGICTVVSTAAEKKPPDGTNATNHSSASATLSISGGKAECSGKIRGIIGKTTKTSIHLYLQKYTDGTWKNVDDWTSSGDTVNRTLTKTKSVSKGYKYRTKAVCRAYIGSKSEKVTKYSSAVSY